MIPIKIQCGCGQRYAFDAEPVDGRLASPVNCPACGVDGTTEADKIIALSQPMEPVHILPSPPAAPSPAPRIRLHVATAEVQAASTPGSAGHIPAGAPHASQLGLVDRDQAVIEARAKVSWGDPPENVLKYLMIQGFKHDEASALVTDMFKARALVVRGKGIKKIVIGLLMICAGTAGIIYMFSIKFVVRKLFGGMLALAGWGLWLVINGAIMAALPKMSHGDVAEQ